MGLHIRLQEGTPTTAPVRKPKIFSSTTWQFQRYWTRQPPKLQTKKSPSILLKNISSSWAVRLRPKAFIMGTNSDLSIFSSLFLSCDHSQVSFRHVSGSGNADGAGLRGKAHHEMKIAWLCSGAVAQNPVNRPQRRPQFMWKPPKCVPYDPP